MKRFLIAWHRFWRIHHDSRESVFYGISATHRAKANRHNEKITQLKKK